MNARRYIQRDEIFAGDGIKMIGTVDTAAGIDGAGLKCLGQRNLRRTVSSMVAGMVTLIVVVALTGSIASANVSHALVSSFEGGETPVGAFGLISSITVDNSGGADKGDVYIVEISLATHTSAVDRFDSSGKYTGLQITGVETPQGAFSIIASSAVAVDNSSSVNKGDVYVGDVGNKVVDKFTESGHFVCQITGTPSFPAQECNGGAGSETPNESFKPTGIVVNSIGDVYVADREHEVIDEFGPSGEYLTQIVDSHVTKPGALAINSSGDLYVLNLESNVVEFSAAGAFMSVVDENGPTAVSVNPSDNHVYAVDTSPEPQVAEYGGNGKRLDVFGPGDFKRALGLTVDGSSGHIYVPEETGGFVDVFGPDAILPDLTTGSASNIGDTSATLSGIADPDTVDGGGDVTACEFVYGTNTSYGQTSACSPAVPYSSVKNVSASLSGLSPDTTYHFRLEASSSEGSAQAEDGTFTTSGPPVIDSEYSNAKTTSATLKAEIDPFGFATACQVEYVSDTSYLSTGYAGATTLPCNPEEVGPGFADISAGAIVNGLELDTLYHFRFQVTSSAGMAVGGDQTFATFGVASFSMRAFDQESKPYTQAGGHPYALVTSFALNTTTFPGGGTGLGTDANPKDVRTELPPGLIGNPEATPKCPPYNVAHADCSGAAQVGILKVETQGGKESESPIYNLVPPAGMAAQLGARFNGFVTAHIDASVRTGGDYGVTADALYLSAAEGLTGATVTLWGVPADPSHDEKRYCPAVNKVNEEGPCQERGPLVPFLTNPTSCEGPQISRLRADSWQEQGAYVSATSEMTGMTGCEKLDFSPTMSVLPESHSTDSPSGLQVDLKIPQNENPSGLAEAQLKNVSVTLPQGVTVNPSQANGLQACSLAQIAMSSPEPANCPDASKVGSVEVHTPLVDHPLLGSVYVAAQNENPFHSLLALYVAVNDPQTGVVIKLAGKVSLDPATGQVTSTFEENPQLPFEDLVLHLFGGERAALATPATCGTYASGIQLTPWSAPQSGLPTGLTSSFALTSGPGGSQCAPQGFAPALTAGTSSNQAGAFSPFTLTLSRNDGEQRLGKVSVQMPPGIAAILANVPRCAEAQANAGTCPAASQIGHVTVTAGVGGDPVTLPAPGKPQDPVYLTGPYGGAPFGLSIVVPAEAGPFNLDENGRPVVVRSKIEVDPHTAQVSVISDPLPSILQGVPTDVRTVNVTIDRARFTFNPTNCNAMSVSGSVGSTQGAQANVSSRFQAANCSALAFKPKFSVAASPMYSRANGLGLTLTIKPVAGQANTGKVRLVFPKQLPTRLSTLKLACLAKVFEANPADCSKSSIVGSATAHTPVLAAPLTGPIYLVSYGGAAFPDAEVVLQGEGIKLVMDGKTNIQKGITSSTFESVPDAPFSSFQAHLPAGPHSAFAAIIKGKRNGSLCGQNLKLDNIFVGQNGIQLKQATKITATNCPRHKKKKKK